MTKKTSAERRLFLKAAGVTLALPMLESFTRRVRAGSGVAVGATAHAAKGSPPVRMVCVGNLLGFYPPAFFPKNSDSGRYTAGIR